MKPMNEQTIKFILAEQLLLWQLNQNQPSYNEQYYLNTITGIAKRFKVKVNTKPVWRQTKDRRAMYRVYKIIINGQKDEIIPEHYH